MRRKISLTAAAVALVALTTAVAAFAAQVNTYTVSGAITGGKGATKSKNKPVGVKFDYTVGEQSGNRPSPVKAYAINFGGVLVNPTAVPGCDVKKLNDPNNTKGKGLCPSKSLVGGGSIINQVGPSEDITNKSLYCYLTLTTINSTTRNHLLLWLEGGPSASSDPKKNCVTTVNQAIDAKFVKNAAGTSLQFTVPLNLLHPGGVGVLDNAVTNVQSTINKVTGKVSGKKVGYFASYACAKSQNIAVAFTQESDSSVKVAKTTVPCT